MQQNTVQKQSFKLKGRLFTFTVISLQQNDLVMFKEYLKEVIAKAPKLFNGTPVVLDCSLLSTFDLNAFCLVLREEGLIPVAIQGASPFLETIAKSMGLATLHGSSQHDKELTETQNIHQTQSKIVSTPIRSGQQVVNREGDLIITSSVSYGAELLASGNIHIYGTLRGRALAGISGDKNTRIFCQALEAELVSIAGNYRLSDALTATQGPSQVYLKDDYIYIESLC